MKRGRKRESSFELAMSTNTKTLEKKPNRGGTPASERIVRLNILV
jgi:hypothetical protein